ncbi:response regulator [Pseudomonas sp. GD03842]|uniref:response regulator n=1 Tax=unclassified Pseudomonas TaxID=196821 RepID=UPI000D3425E4|nr:MULTISPECIES: response regulator [unclassified Pseudomonas]MDH0748199.1 response regulator [Pseudomonas sp. GD03842]RAU47472.1 response regulator [Pseudomonas sp. RIT 409]RAU51853.1 response regulator [Pseudomonas sp. RIT 412]
MAITALLVEDEEALRTLITEALTLIEVETVECVSADDALRLLGQPHAFNLVITDICMPGACDGLELARTIWAKWPNLPVILSSGNRIVLDSHLPDNASFLRKPWSLDDLHQVVGSHLKR